MKSLNPTASLGLVLALAACGGDAANSSGDDAPEVLASMTPTRTRVLAVNDLGMHCMDREDSVFSILPPFNVVHAQVVKPGPVNGKPIHRKDDAQKHCGNDGKSIAGSPDVNAGG